MEGEIMKNISKALVSLELKLRKGVLENEYFGDSYICGIADKLLEIQGMIENINAEPCTLDGGDMDSNTISLKFDNPDRVKGLRMSSKASVILERK